MRKTILAMAVPALLVAGAANASVNLYNADGVVVDLSGAAEIQYIQQYLSSDGSNKIDPYLLIDDADLLISTSIEITDGLNAVAGMGFKYEAKTLIQGTERATTDSDELYVGLSSDFGTLTFGRQILIADDMGNAKDYELGTEQTNFIKTDGHQVIKWLFDNGTFYAGADIDLDSNTTTGVDGTQVIGGRLGARFMGADARIYLYDGENLDSNAFAPSSVSNQDVTGFNLEVDYVFGAFDFSASYGQVEYKDSAASTSTPKVSNQNKVDTWQVSAGYQANEKTYFAMGYDGLNSTASGTYLKRESSSLYANVSYSLHSNARVYAEVGVANMDIQSTLGTSLVDQDPNTGYLLGMEVTF